MTHTAAIYRSIEQGQIERAYALCQSHFPTVLADDTPSTSTPPASSTVTYTLDPSLLSLNMQLQQLVEYLRSLYTCEDADDEPLETAVRWADTLRTRIDALPPDAHAAYATELEQLMGLFAYRCLDDVPETLAPALHLSRRSALAQQVNSAILQAEGTLPTSLLSRVTRQAACTWDHLHDRAVVIPRDHPSVALIGPTRCTSVADGVIPPPLDWLTQPSSMAFDRP